MFNLTIVVTLKTCNNCICVSPFTLVQESNSNHFGFETKVGRGASPRKVAGTLARFGIVTVTIATGGAHEGLRVRFGQGGQDQADATVGDKARVVRLRHLEHGDAFHHGRATLGRLGNGLVLDCFSHGHGVSCLFVCLLREYKDWLD